MMVDQAAEAVMAAFKDGIVRQSVRLSEAQYAASTVLPRGCYSGTDCLCFTCA